MSDYKSTLNLPQTDFPMKANLSQREPQRLKQWQEMDLYGLMREAGAGKPKFILHDGPPYANGELHIGDDLNLLGSGAISHINCSGNNNKAIQFNSTNSTGAKTQVSRFSVAESVLNGTQTYISSQKIHVNSGDLVFDKAAAAQYITVSGAATKSLAIETTNDESASVTA